jgi:hypothetical protein
MNVTIIFKNLYLHNVIYCNGIDYGSVSVSLIISVLFYNIKQIICSFLKIVPPNACLL